MNNEHDIVDRLRSVGGYFDAAALKYVSCSEAADEIERLRNALAQSVKIGSEHREGRLKALEWMAALESRLQEIGDLAASCRTGPALREAMAQIETMADMRHNASNEGPAL